MDTIEASQDQIATRSTTQAGRRPSSDAYGWLAYISKDANRGECEFCTATSFIKAANDTM